MIDVENWSQTTKTMKKLDVALPPEEKLHNPTFGEPAFYVASALMAQQDQAEKYGVNASYINPKIEVDSRPSPHEFDITFPPEVLMLAQTIKSLGGRAVLVGGCIRDLLYDQIADTKTEAKDFDVEVYGLDLQTLTTVLHRIFPNYRISTDGKSFGVTKVDIPSLKEPLDVALAREDISTGDSHQEFESVMSPRMTYRHGSRRRDLRFNSAMYDPLLKTLYDPFLGTFDLQKSEINVTDPETFVEDPLRVLRVMQFAARFEMTPTKPTMELCTRMVTEGKLDTLSANRIRDELIKLLKKSQRPSIGLQFAREVGFVQRAWPELHALIDVPQHQKFHKEGDVWNHTLQTIDAAALIAKREQLDDITKLTLLLTLLCHDMGKPSTTTAVDGIFHAYGHEAAGVAPTTTFLERLNFPINIQKYVLSLVPKHMRIPQLYKQEHPTKEGVEPTLVDTALKRLHRKVYSQTGMTLAMLMLVTEADHKGRNGETSLPLTDEELPEIVELKEWFTQKIAELDLDKKPQEKLLDNNEFLTHIGVKNCGPLMGIIERCVLLDQEENLVTSREAALARALRYFTQMQLLLGPEETVTAKKHYAFWQEMLRNEDPRNVLTSSTNVVTTSL